MPVLPDESYTPAPPRLPAPFAQIRRRLGVMAGRIDVNADLGESFGAWTMGVDDELLGLVSSANVACGFHAGDPTVMDRTVARAVRAGVAVGAHPPPGRRLRES